MSIPIPPRTSGTRERPRKSLAYELFILLISILSIVNLVLLALVAITVPDIGPAGQVVLTMDVALTPVFLADFLYRLLTAPLRRVYLRTGGWLDLLAILPVLRILRAVRIAQVIRWLRSAGRARVADELAESRASATFLLTVFLVFVVVEAAGATIYAAEIGDPSSNIRSAGDAIWWGLVTITTVGYGDRYPVTFEGRIIGVFLLFAGIALFSVLTGFIANVFLAPRRRRMLAPQADDSRATIKTLRALIDEQDERNAQIRLQLDDLERVMASTPAGSDATPDRSG